MGAVSRLFHIAVQPAAYLAGSLFSLAASPATAAAVAPGGFTDSRIRTVAYAADEAPAEGGALTEIVVTAQKVTENVQNVPISVAVLDSEALNQLGIVNLDDYVKFSPSVS